MLILTPEHYKITHLDSCVVFFQDRQHKLPFPNSQTFSEQNFDLINVNVWGPFKVQNHDRYKYSFDNF